MDGSVDRQIVDFAARFAGAKGRPIRNRMASARVTAAELERLEGAAREEGKLLAEWAREVLLREAERTKEDAVFTELVSMRMLLNNVLKVVATGQKMTVENFHEIQTGIRGDKKKVAAELMRQYTTQDRKEP